MVTFKMLMRNCARNVEDMLARTGVKAAVREEEVFLGEITGKIKVPLKLA